ncbi:hypothetical protein Gorai_021817, partial [Gossypium raimondii]|nr:hypothetical protein [Gossypium raimondii]
DLLKKRLFLVPILVFPDLDHFGVSFYFGNLLRDWAWCLSCFLGRFFRSPGCCGCCPRFLMAKDINKLFARLTFLKEEATQMVGVNKPLLDFIGHKAWVIGRVMLMGKINREAI